MEGKGEGEKGGDRPVRRIDSRVGEGEGGGMEEMRQEDANVIHPSDYSRNTVWIEESCYSDNFCNLHCFK